MKLGIVNVRREMHLLLQAPFFGLIPAREELAINVAKAHMTTTLLVEVFCPVCTQLEISVPYPIGHEQFESWVKMGKAHDETTILQIPNSFFFSFSVFPERGSREANVEKIPPKRIAFATKIGMTALLSIRGQRGTKRNCPPAGSPEPLKNP